MKNNIDKLVEKFEQSENVNNEVKNEVTKINNVIVEKDIELKREVLSEIENKYKEILDARGYYKIKNLVDSKSYMVNNEKELNTLLGNLKLWIVRCEYLKNNKNKDVEEIYSKIEKENDVEKIYKLLDKADGLMIE